MGVMVKGRPSTAELGNVVGSVVQSLYRLEIGHHDKAVFQISWLMHRQLLRERSSADKAAAPAQSTNAGRRNRPNSPNVKDADSRLKPTTTFQLRKEKEDSSHRNETPIFKRSGMKRGFGFGHTMLDTGSTPTTVIVLDEYFFVRKRSKHSADEPYYCFPTKSSLNTGNDFLNPKYNLPGKGRWLNWELFYPARPNPDPIICTKRFGPAIFVLEKDSPWLTVYDFDSGRQLNKLYLDPAIKFVLMRLCWYDLSGFVLQSSPASLPKHLSLDFIVLAYPPLRVSIRCQIAKDAFPKNTGLEISGYFLFARYSNSIEVCDLKSVLDSEFEYKPEIRKTNDSDRKSVVVTHYIRSKLPVLVKVKNCFQAYLDISTWGSPPYVVTKSEDGKFKMYDTDGDKLGNSELLNLNLKVPDDIATSTLDFHPDDSSRLILCGGNQLRILKLLKREMNDDTKGQTYLETEFDISMTGESFAQPIEEGRPVAVAARKSLRIKNSPKVPCSYVDLPEVAVRWEYHVGLNLFAIMELFKPTLRFHLYENQNWSPITVIEPMKWTLPSTTKCSHDAFMVPLTSFDFTDTHMIVQTHENGHNTSKVYMANFLAEAVPESLELEAPDKKKAKKTKTPREK